MSHKLRRWSGGADGRWAGGGPGSLCFLQRPEGELQNSPFIIPLTQTDYTIWTASPSPTTPFLCSSTFPLLSITPNLIFFCFLFVPSYPLLFFFFLSFAFFLLPCFLILASSNQIIDLHPSETSGLSFNLVTSFFFPSHLPSFPLGLAISPLVTCCYAGAASAHKTVWAHLDLHFWHFLSSQPCVPTFPIYSSSEHFYLEPVPDLRAHQSCTRTRWSNQDSASILISLPSLCPWILDFGSIDFHPKFYLSHHLAPH